MKPAPYDMTKPEDRSRWFKEMKNYLTLSGEDHFLIQGTDREGRRYAFDAFLSMEKEFTNKTGLPSCCEETLHQLRVKIKRGNLNELEGLSGTDTQIKIINWIDELKNKCDFGIKPIWKVIQDSNNKLLKDIINTYESGDHPEITDCCDTTDDWYGFGWADCEAKFVSYLKSLLHSEE